MKIMPAHWMAAPVRPIPAFWLSCVFWLLGIAMAALHAWAASQSHSMNADGIAYLDIGDAYMRGDWDVAVNPVWSPLYSWILGAVMALARPSMRWEFPLVHLVNFAIFVGAFLSFEFFWQQLGRYREESGSGGGLPLPAWAWQSLGYLQFLWATLTLIAIWAVTPDMLMAVFVLVAAGLLVRLRFGDTRWLTFILLGLALGLGYLAKSIMFPLAFVFLAVALLTPGDLRHSLPRTAAAFFVFLLISLPYIALISSVQGHFTFGESGTITYLRYINRIPYPHWQGDASGFGALIHPSRQIFDELPVYEFGEPVGGTYPISTNPVYWYQGAAPQFDLDRQLHALMSHGLYFFDLFFRQQGGLLMGAVLLYFLGGWTRVSWREIPRKWGLSLIALMTFAAYSLVYVEGRYIGVFVLLFWGDLLANLRLSHSPQLSKATAVTSLAMIGFVLANLMTFNLAGYQRLGPATAGIAANDQSPPAWPGEVAETLWQQGLEPGDTVAVMGYAFDSYWARLARLKIVAEMPPEYTDRFWWSEPALQQQVVEAFARTGAEAIVAEYVPSHADVTGWQRVGNSSFYVRRLTGSDSP